MASDTHELVERFVGARGGGTLAVLEGFHPLKHAIRFGAAIEQVVVLADTREGDLPSELAGVPAQLVRHVPAEVFDRLLPARPPVPVVAIARRPTVTPRDVLDAAGPVVVLERPTHAGNVGAVVRVAAAASAGGVLVVGGLDPWSPAALRGAAGLQFALPVTRTAGPLATDRAIVAFDPEGVDLRSTDLPPDPVLAFGTERAGLSDRLRRTADAVVAIPMRAGVSSLNLATSVAVALYRLPGAGGAPPERG